MAKMASLHAEQFDVSRETNETPYTAGFRAGLDWERERIIQIITSGEAGCDKEGAHYYCAEICDIEKLIALIKGETTND